MNEKQPLVSMITYCFNGERFISKYFEAVLAQTYQNIELIFINNGSVDRTGEIAEEYKGKLEARGIQVQLIHYKENQSTCLMKQEGFRLMHGDYFFGCDSDDLIHPDYIEKMSSYLVEHQEKGIVFCELAEILEETGERLRKMREIPRTGEKEALLDIIMARNTIFTGIGYMMSRKHFLKVNPEKKIHISMYGENYQVQIPFLYYDLQGYIQEELGDYIVRRDSYSETFNVDHEKRVRAYKGQEESIIATFEQMHVDDAAPYILIAQKRLRKERLYASYYLKDKKLKKECFRELKEVGGVGAREVLTYLFSPIYLYFQKKKQKKKALKKK